MSEANEAAGRRYVVGVDGSEGSRAALRWAAAEAARHGAELEVVHESNSWRLTAPLRWSIRCACACVGRSLQVWRTLVQAQRRLGALLLEMAVKTALRTPWLKRSLLQAVSSIPGLRERA